jgi:hypothetical protein
LLTLKNMKEGDNEGFSGISGCSVLDREEKSMI